MVFLVLCFKMLMKLLVTWYFVLICLSTDAVVKHKIKDNIYKSIKSQVEIDSINSLTEINKQYTLYLKSNSKQELYEFQHCVQPFYSVHGKVSSLSDHVLEEAPSISRFLFVMAEDISNNTWHYLKGYPEGNNYCNMMTQLQHCLEQYKIIEIFDKFYTLNVVNLVFCSDEGQLGLLQLHACSPLHNIVNNKYFNTVKEAVINIALRHTKAFWLAPLYAHVNLHNVVIAVIADRSVQDGLVEVSSMLSEICGEDSEMENLIAVILIGLEMMHHKTFPKLKDTADFSWFYVNARFVDVTAMIEYEEQTLSCSGAHRQVQFLVPCLLQSYYYFAKLFMQNAFDLAKTVTTFCTGRETSASKCMSTFSELCPATETFHILALTDRFCAVAISVLPASFTAVYENWFDSLWNVAFTETDGASDCWKLIKVFKEAKPLHLTRSLIVCLVQFLEHTAGLIVKNREVQEQLQILASILRNYSAKIESEAFEIYLEFIRVHSDMAQETIVETEDGIINNVEPIVGTFKEQENSPLSQEQNNSPRFDDEL